MAEIVVVGVSRQAFDRRKLAGLYFEGTRRATRLMRDVVEKGKTRGHRYQFDGDLVKAAHREVMFYAHPDARGVFRDPSDDSTEVDTIPAVPGHLIPIRFHRYSQWLQDSAQRIRDNNDDLPLAIRIAAEAHWVLASHLIHPFPDGNNRTAGVIMNGLLMLGSRELIDYGHGVPPIPRLNDPNCIATRKRDTYLLALQNVRETLYLNRFEQLMAERWVVNLRERLRRIKEHIAKPSKADQALINQFELRAETLNHFIDSIQKDQPHSLTINF